MKRTDKPSPSSKCVKEKKEVSQNGSTLGQNLAEVEPRMIAQLAYEFFEKGGGKHGLDCDDWLEAERQLQQTVEKN